MIHPSTSEALKDITHNKLFSTIMVLAVVVSIFSISAVVMIGEGTKMRIVATLRGFGFGSDSIVVLGVPGKLAGHRSKRPRTITFRDVELLSMIKGLKYISPHQVKRWVTVSYKDKEITTWIIGTTPQYPFSMDIELIEGRFFTEDEMKGLEKVCVLGYKPYKEFFPNGDAVGRYVRIGNGLYKVVGVIEKLGHLGRFDVDDRIVVPITITRRMILKSDYINTVKMVFYPWVDIKRMVGEVEDILRKTHHIKPGFPDDFSVITADDVVSFVNRAVKNLTDLLFRILLIALFLSALVIVNVMLAAVSERRREIGIKRAIGASRLDIFLEYIQYSLFISLMGSSIGVIIASVLGRLLSGRLPLYINYKPFLLSAFFGIFVGVISGFYPAKRACEVSPVEALRH